MMFRDIAIGQPVETPTGANDSALFAEPDERCWRDAQSSQIVWSNHFLFLQEVEDAVSLFHSNSIQNVGTYQQMPTFCIYANPYRANPTNSPPYKKQTPGATRAERPTPNPQSPLYSTTTRSVPLLPKTSGEYISSAFVGGTINVPGVVARATYV